MSETWVDAEDYEDLGEGAYDSDDLGEGAYDSDDLGEGVYDSDDAGEDFGEESRSARRRRERQRQIMLARQRQIMLARQRQAQMRRRRRPPLPARRPVGAPRPTPPAIRAVRSLDLETKVELDSLRRAVEESNRRANQANWAAVAGTAVNQGLDSFSPNLTNQYLRAGARFAPMLFLSPGKKKGGAAGVITDPRVIAGASILGIALLHNFTTSTVHSVLIDPYGPLTAPAGIRPGTPVLATGTLVAAAKGRLGISVPNAPFTWTSNNPILHFPDQSKGIFTATVTAGTATPVVVTATTPNNVTATLTVTVGP
jgi:hypothetical protein